MFILQHMCSLFVNWKLNFIASRQLWCLFLFVERKWLNFQMRQVSSIWVDNFKNIKCGHNYTQSMSIHIKFKKNTKEFIKM